MHRNTPGEVILGSLDNLYLFTFHSARFVKASQLHLNIQLGHPFIYNAVPNCIIAVREHHHYKRKDVSSCIDGFHSTAEPFQIFCIPALQTEAIAVYTRQCSFFLW